MTNKTQEQKPIENLESRTYLETGMYFCMRLPPGSYTLEPNVSVSQNKVNCKLIIGADCFHREYPVNLCPIWEEAWKKHEALLAQTPTKCTEHAFYGNDFEAMRAAQRD